MNDLRETPSSSGRAIVVKLRRFASNCKLCSSVLPKPMPTSSTTWSAATPPAFNRSSRSLKKFADFAHDVRVNRIFLHGSRRALRVHANVTGLELRHNLPHRIVFAVGGHIIDDARAGCKRGARHGGFHRVNGNAGC